MKVATVPRRRMPTWTVTRYFFVSGTHTQARVTVGKFRAWTRDQAIEKAAHAIKRIALLSAERIR